MGSATISVLGTLGKDPEQRNVGDYSVVSFNLAVSKKIKGEEHTNWFRCSFWGKRGDVILQYVKKGQQIYVVGEFESREYQANDGTVKTSLDVRVHDFSFINDPENRNTGSDGYTQGAYAPKRQAAAYGSTAYTSNPDDEIPF